MIHPRSDQTLGLLPLAAEEECLGEVSEDEAPETVDRAPALAQQHGLALDRDRLLDPPEVEEHRAEVDVCPGDLERVVARQVHGAMEIRERAVVGALVRHRGRAGDESGSVRAWLAECVGEVDRLVSEANRLVGVAGDHVVARGVCEHVRVLRRRLDAGGQLERPRHPLGCRGAVPVPPGDV